ncbi:MAG: hypothetical protein EAX96_13570 [Candidatus Lokiarchaeota archaeon]|nr:hypothetical protein [Candidatus Lokiarchaeota archaeon]
MKAPEFLGKILAEETGKKLIHCSGMIRLAFKDANKDPDTPIYKEIKEVIENYLKKRLDNVKIQNSDGIIRKLVSELTKNQSIFSLAI